jgi:CheY-like chemotaxis protein
MISTVWDVTWRKKAEERVERDLSRLRSLVSIFQYPAKSIQDLLDYALEQAIQITESKIGYIYHYHEDRKEFVLNTWSKEVMAECAVANPPTCYELDKTGIWGEAVRQRKPIVVNNFLAESPLKKGYPAGHVQLLKFMTVPIFKDGAIVGVVGLANKETNYEEGDILQCSLLLETVWRIIDRKKIEQSLEQIAGEKEETRIELVETAKEKEETRKELIKTANALKEIATEKEETRIKLVETAELLKQIAGEKEKETRLNKILLDALPCVAILLRYGTREIIAMNKVAEEAGCRIGQTCYGSWPKLNEPCSFCQAPEACATCTEKHAVVEADGIIWDIYWTPINNDLFMHYAFDITELKRAKEVLKKVQETLRTTIGNVEVKKILVIDDNEDYINMMKFLVSRSLPGCEVFVSMDGEQGIEIAKKEDPEVILLDIIMPKMNGFEVCKQIKADEQLSSIPIIFMTGMSTIESSRIKALEAGGDLFLSKPVNSEELITQVKAMAKIKASNRLRKFEKDSQ